MADTPSRPPPLKAPPAILDGVIAAGAAKAAMPPLKIFILAIVSGCHIAFGGMLSLSVAGDVPGLSEDNPGLQRMLFGAVFPFGLMMTVITGAELFTSSTAYVSAALFDGKTDVLALAKSWGITYLGNLVGSLVVASLFATADVLPDSAQYTALAKVSKPWSQIFVRAILANWLVCLATWMAAGCDSLTSKMVAIWFPISAFVAMGLEHSIANMSIIPVGMLLGAPISVRSLVADNLVPATLGNAVGGVLAVALPYTLAFKHCDGAGLGGCPGATAVGGAPDEASEPLSGRHLGRGGAIGDSASTRRRLGQRARDAESDSTSAKHVGDAVAYTPVVVASAPGPNGSVGPGDDRSAHAATLSS